jgi:hypothetical protein
MGQSAELGPLDPQLFDTEQGEYRSALQYLDDYKTVSKNCGSELSIFGNRGSDWRLNVLNCVRATIGTAAPQNWARVVQRADAVAVVKVVEEQAIRLLLAKHARPEAEAIAERLVLGFPDHDFPIQSAEANSIGLVTEVASMELTDLLDALATKLGNQTLVGRLPAGAQLVEVG